MSVEESPEFQKALNEACERQYRGFLYGGNYARAHSKDTIADTMDEIQKQRAKIEAENADLRRMAEDTRRQASILSSAPMREITKNFKRKYGSSGLICPACGEGDHGNKMNGRPVCLMNAKHKKHGITGPVLLTTLEKAVIWKPPKGSSKRTSFTFTEVDGVVIHRPRSDRRR